MPLTSGFEHDFTKKCPFKYNERYQFFLLDVFQILIIFRADGLLYLFDVRNDSKQTKEGVEYNLELQAGEEIVMPPVLTEMHIWIPTNKRLLACEISIIDRFDGLADRLKFQTVIEEGISVDLIAGDNEIYGACGKKVFRSTVDAGRPFDIQTNSNPVDESLTHLFYHRKESQLLAVSKTHIYLIDAHSMHPIAGEKCTLPNRAIFLMKDYFIYFARHQLHRCQFNDNSWDDYVVLRLNEDGIDVQGLIAHSNGDAVGIILPGEIRFYYASNGQEFDSFKNDSGILESFQWHFLYNKIGCLIERRHDRKYHVKLIDMDNAETGRVSLIGETRNGYHRIAAKPQISCGRLTVLSVAPNDVLQLNIFDLGDDPGSARGTI